MVIGRGNPKQHTILSFVQVFNMGRGLYNPEHKDRVHIFYNTTAGSLEVSDGGTPRPFRIVPDVGMDSVYPIVLDVGIVGSRAEQIKQFLIDGNYFATSWSQIEVQVRIPSRC